MNKLTVMKSIILNDNTLLKNTLKSRLVDPNFLLNGKTPIAMAVNLKNTESVKLLMRHNCYPDNMNPPLHLAVKKGDLNEVQSLIDRGEYINNVLYENGYTPLNLAVASGFTQIVRLLLENGADPDICDTNLITPLHMAIRKKYKEIMNLLLIFNADPNLEDCYRCTPLIHTCVGGDYDACNSLISYGADVNFITSAGDTALRSSIDNNKAHIVRLLLDKEANCNILFECNFELCSIMEIVNRSEEITKSISAIIAAIVLSKYKDLDHISKVGKDKNLTAINNFWKFKYTASRCETELNILSQIMINGYSLLDIYNEKLWHLVQGNASVILYDRVLRIDKDICFYNYILENMVSMASKSK
ncbi:SWPV1-287 [Shearwaterpox virus]|uniref:SWPV1-287 n=1 Tax=Shearwaterpox virus TaxID=1974596 RepID=A0A1V0S889_CNPV|nr:SWPV1-287 [Shearwaterpox virus]